jgi:hypothetical protein
MITRKHFEAIAGVSRILNKVLIDSGELIFYSDLQLVIDMVDDMCDMCRQDNPNFDRDKFIKACGFP